MILRNFCLVTVMLLTASSWVSAQVPLLTPTDPIFGGQVQGANFQEGQGGFVGNTWPFTETPMNVIDGVGQKYLNFAELDTGFVVSPSGGSSIATGLKLWTANDAEERDPASYEIWGTNSPISGGTIPLSDFTQISTGAVNLPATRNAAGAAPLLEANSDTISFANSDTYSSYLVFFPTVKNAAAANSMQVAEVQILGVPDLDQTLSLEVNQTNGSMTLVNGASAPSVELNGYQIRSDMGSLNPAGWNSFADNPSFPAASAPGAGDGWEVGGGVNNMLLAEAFLLGSSMIGPDQSIPLGQAYNTSVGAEDLAISYSRPDGFQGQVPVVYVTSDITCDFDGSGTCDGMDIDMLTENIAIGPADPGTFDLTGDGVVDQMDLDEWRAQAGAANLPSGNAYLEGDANLDGAVDGQDFIAWNGNKFSANATWTGGDFNASGTVDGQDFIIWNANKFQSADAVAVPEPQLGTTVILALLTAGLLRRRLAGIVRRGVIVPLLGFLVLGTALHDVEAANKFRIYDFETGVPTMTTTSVVDSLQDTIVQGTGDNADFIWLEVPGGTTRPLPPGPAMTIVDANALAGPNLDSLFGSATYVDVSGSSAFPSPAPGSSVALQFDGTATLEDALGHRAVLVTNDAYNNNDPIANGSNTFEQFSVISQAWVRPDSSAMGTEQVVYQIGQEQGAAAITSDGFWKVSGLGSFVPGDELTTTAPVEFDQWSHVAIARFGAEIQMYVNGETVAQSEPNAFFNTFAANTSLGSGEFGVSPFTGLVDDFTMSSFADGLFNPQDDLDFFETVELELLINQETGQATISNSGSNPETFSQLSILSGRGGIDAANWLSISGNYDLAGNGTVDMTDNWTVSVNSNVEVAEAETPLNDGATLAPGQTVELGEIWFPNPGRDVVVDLFNPNGDRVPMLVNYVDENGVEVPAIVAGDLDFEGTITLDDWAIFQQSFGSIFTGIGPAESYGFGDLDGDLDVDLDDFQAFVAAYDAANGAGSFAATIPEPAFGSLSLLVLALIWRRSGK